WAPHWVHDELRDARLAATGCQHDAVLWDAEAQLLQPGTPERVRADADTHAAQTLGAIYQARVEQLQFIDTARRQWHHHTEAVRTRYEHAGTELVRRGLDRNPTPPVADQRSLPGLDVDGTTVIDQDTQAQQAGVQPDSESADQIVLFNLTRHPSHVAAAQ